MNNEHWRKVEEIFHTAMACEYERRGAYLDEACGGDLALRRDIASLLGSAEEAAHSGFLDDPVKLTAGGARAVEQLVGSTLDEKYRIERELGRGGMGAVYLATHLGTRRPVAIKVIAPQFMAHPEFVERFKREAEAAGQLRHVNVVNVTDFGFATVAGDRLAYLVMEYLDGYSLATLLKKEGALPLHLTVDIVEQISLAVEEAHRHGIIHRDLKPDNIWLEPTGRGGYNVKVLDFGLAKLRETSSSNGPAMSAVMGALPAITLNEERQRNNNAAHATGSESVTQRFQVADKSGVTSVMDEAATHGQIEPRTIPEWLTRVGTILGTPLYMSPEQCHGHALDTQSDIYSLGVMVYEMLTGETPFKGDLYELIAQHSERPPAPLAERRKGLPKGVARVVMSALAKAPCDRPGSALGFATALKAASESESTMLRKAIALYGERFSTFVAIGLLAYLPFIAAINVGLTVPFLISFQFTSFTLYVFTSTLFLFMFGWYSQGVINGGVAVPLVARMMTGQARDFRLLPALTGLKRGLRPFVSGSYRISLALLILIMAFPSVRILREYGYIAEDALVGITLCLVAILTILAGMSKEKETMASFYAAPLAFFEGLAGDVLKNRAGELTQAIMDGRIKIFSLFMVVILSAFGLTATLGWSVIKLLEKGLEPAETVIPISAAVFGLVLSLSLGVLVTPLLSIGYALNYIKARQMGGETLDQIISR